MARGEPRTKYAVRLTILGAAFFAHLDGIISCQPHARSQIQLECSFESSPESLAYDTCYGLMYWWPTDGKRIPQMAINARMIVDKAELEGVDVVKGMPQKRNPEQQC